MSPESLAIGSKEYIGSDVHVGSNVSNVPTKYFTKVFTAQLKDTLTGGVMSAYLNASKKDTDISGH